MSGLIELVFVLAMYVVAFFVIVLGIYFIGYILQKPDVGVGIVCVIGGCWLWGWANEKLFK